VNYKQAQKRRRGVPGRPKVAFPGLSVKVTYVMRQKVPFGIAQIGKAFRNEITPRSAKDLAPWAAAMRPASRPLRQFLFRSREFEQMEIEYFIDPEETKERAFTTGEGSFPRRTSGRSRKNGSRRCGTS